METPLKYIPRPLERSSIALDFFGLEVLFSPFWYKSFPTGVNSAMAKKKSRDPIKLKSTESEECYWTVKNRKNTTERLELKKYDKKLRRHVTFKEVK